MTLPAWRYALRHPDGGYIGVDDNSGGYPYRPSPWGDIKFWPSREDAIRYKLMFSNSETPRIYHDPDKWEVVKVQLVEVPDGVLYDGTKIDKRDMFEALWAAGLETLDSKSFGELFVDLTTDTYFNDPKCISRRIRLENGDPGGFYSYLKDKGYRFDD